LTKKHKYILEEVFSHYQTGESHMQLMKQFNKRLNLNISPKTYEKIKKVANKEGRKTGNLARQILERWAKNRKVL